MAKGICWAAPSNAAPVDASVLSLLQQWFGLKHWSREFEYPWAIRHANLAADKWVLDAGGGNDCNLMQFWCAATGCRVVNLEIDPEQFPRYRVDPRILNVVGNIAKAPFTDCSFDNVICVSVLEHTDDPHKCMSELWRVLRPGGRLTVTMDVSSRIHPTLGDDRHCVDLAAAVKIVSLLGLEVPPVPFDYLYYHRDDGLMLSVLCFFADKE